MRARHSFRGPPPRPVEHFSVGKSCRSWRCSRLVLSLISRSVMSCERSMVRMDSSVFGSDSRPRLMARWIVACRRVRSTSRHSTEPFAEATAGPRQKQQQVVIAGSNDVTPSRPARTPDGLEKQRHLLPRHRFVAHGTPAVLSQIQLLGEPSGGIARQEPIADGTVETAPEHAMNAAHGARLQGLLLGQQQVPDGEGLEAPDLHSTKTRQNMVRGGFAVEFRRADRTRDRDLLQPVLHIIRERDIRIEGDAGRVPGVFSTLASTSSARSLVRVVIERRLPR